jgi:TonB family protein
VDRGPAATTAGEQDARIRDNVDAELLAARLQRSFVEASTQRAERRGAGTGGPQSDGAGLGLRGVGVGASASPYAPGHGSDFALDTRDSRYLRWITEQRARIRKALVFPLARALAKDQGTTIYRVIVQRNGRLSGTPRLIRSSGFADFDAAAQAAIRHATPFPPLPKGLAPEQESFAILIPIAFDNPMVE